jgi:D-serine deaminase-like pyridoxal phosphate-dependent protein
MPSNERTRREFLTETALGVAAVGPGARAVSAETRSVSEGAGMRYEDYVGVSLSELPTPALLVDLDIFENNVARMAETCRQGRTKYRPHGKAHKSPLVGGIQLKAGAIGLCAGKLGEAEVFVEGGINDVLITTEVVGPRKIERLMRLAKMSPVMKVVVDNEQNITDLADAAAKAGVRLTALVDVNVGQDRTGIDTADDAATLAQAITRARSLRFGGIQAYGGHNMHIVGFENRKRASLLALERALAARYAIEKAGLPVEILSVGGTGTYNIDTNVPGVTEIQPGSYIFMDIQYRGIGSDASDTFSDFGNSLSVMTTVISRPSKGRAITDGGNKALSSDAGLAMPKDARGIQFQPGGDEHGILLIKDPSRDFKVGDQVEFIPSHCDTTVNLHNVFYAVRKGNVDAVWPIVARGRTD